jgi:hypothetical protein
VHLEFAQSKIASFFSFQRNSISPAEREKYRPRSPPEPEHKKLKKEEKDCHVSKCVGRNAMTPVSVIKLQMNNSYNYNSVAYA